MFIYATVFFALVAASAKAAQSLETVKASTTARGHLDSITTATALSTAIVVFIAGVVSAGGFKPSQWGVLGLMTLGLIVACGLLVGIDKYAKAHSDEKERAKAAKASAKAK